MDKTKVDYDKITTVTVTKKVRAKLGKHINHDETMSEGIDRILDEKNTPTN